MYSSRIEDFWTENKQFWFPVTAEEKRVADEVIFDLFYDYDYEQENVTGRAIFLDQFQRHFQRILGTDKITEEDLLTARKEAARDVDSQMCDLETFSETSIVFCLMPFKHLGDYERIFDYIHNTFLPSRSWGEGAPEHPVIKEYPILARFYYDTYKKAYTQDRITDDTFIQRVDNKYDPAEICDSYPQVYAAGAEDWQTYLGTAACGFENPIESLLNIHQPLIVSLSGGVDSMVLLALLKLAGAPDLKAVHILYGNRQASYSEFAFITEFCKRLGVSLYVYGIEYITRDSVDRAFYEQMTREIRFMVYKGVAGSAIASAKVILGHIQEDVVENIWTNLAHCQHLHNLRKMSATEEQMGVTLARPFLSTSKSQIYALANMLGIPYLKNTTPSWSNRGKFREHFYAATQAQFGEGVDKKLLEVADVLQKQSQMLDRLIYRPIYDSWDPEMRILDITPAVQAELDQGGWSQIFEYVCHKLLATSRPSVHSVAEFCRRLGRLQTQSQMQTQTMQLKKDVKICITYKYNKWTLAFE
jgi:tRNA(Ile)-lysidine synthetase-like protein